MRLFWGKNSTMKDTMWRPPFALLVLSAAAANAAVHSRPWQKTDCTVYTHHLDRPLKAVTNTSFYVRHDGSLRRISMRIYGFVDNWDLSVNAPRGSKNPHEWHKVTIAKHGYELWIYIDGELAWSQIVSFSSKMTHLTVTLKGKGEVTSCDFRGGKGVAAIKFIN